MKNVAIIEGGYSHEKIISLKSAETVFEHIDREKYNPIKVRIDEEGWFAFDGGEKIEMDRTDFSFKETKFDIAFIVIHGTPGEDGKLQAYFDMLDIPYSTCSHFAATLTFDKYVCNQYLKTVGIKVADAVLVREGETVDAAAIVAKVGLPCFVKPNDGGSSFGVTKVKSEAALEKAISLALSHGSQAIVEGFMEGREVTNGIYRNVNGFVALPITEIVTTNDFFDFEAKYEGKSDEITPADLTEDLTINIQALTKQIAELLDMDGIARADYIIQNGEPYLIEINTVPGLSGESIIPQMAACAAMPLKQLFSEVLELALAG